MRLAKARTRMTTCDLTLKTPEENLACDEALLEAAEAHSGGEVLRFWEPTDHFVVLGYGNKMASEVNVDYCAQQGIAIRRRCTGGGTVLQGPGCLNYSLVLRIAEHPVVSISATNQYILERHSQALTGLLKTPVKVEGCSDLAVRNLKFSGNAQRRKREFLLFHGTFLLHMDLGLIQGALSVPSREPDYRGHRSHLEFVMNLGIAAEAMKDALQTTWGAHEPTASIPYDRIQDLAREKYSVREWIERF
jgi:lipoate-protein ligase A